MRPLDANTSSAGGERSPIWAQAGLVAVLPSFFTSGRDVFFSI